MTFPGRQRRQWPSQMRASWQMPSSCWLCQTTCWWSASRAGVWIRTHSGRTTLSSTRRQQIWWIGWSRGPTTLPQSWSYGAGAVMINCIASEFITYPGTALALSCRLASYHTNLSSIRDLYSNILLDIDGDRPPQVVSSDIQAFLQANNGEAPAVPNDAAEVAPLPCWIKTALFGAWLCAHASTIGFNVLGSRCFERVDLMTNISLPPFDGQLHRVVKAPIGYAMNGIFAIGILLALVLVQSWISSVQRPLRKAAVREQPT